MGLTFSSLFQQLFGKKQMRILMVGLDAAGEFYLIKKNIHLLKFFLDFKVKQQFFINLN